jgi:hypothetical protein
MPRFAVLEHDWPHPHLDLLLERDGVLKAWRVPPHFTPDVPTPVTANSDHRLVYLDYEGPLTDGRGGVTRWDGGELGWEAAEEGRLVVRLSGKKLNGMYELVRGETGWVFGPA